MFPGPREEAISINVDSLGVVINCFSTGQHQYWAACTPDPWVISTFSQVYTLQFWHQPLAIAWVQMTIIWDLAKAIALGKEPSTILYKGAIKQIDPTTTIHFILIGTFLSLNDTLQWIKNKEQIDNCESELVFLILSGNEFHGGGMGRGDSQVNDGGWSGCKREWQHGEDQENMEEQGCGWLWMSA